MDAQDFAWKVCYSVRVDGSIREMPSARNIRTHEKALAHAESLRGMGYMVQEPVPDTCG